MLVCNQQAKIRQLMLNIFVCERIYRLKYMQFSTFYSAKITCVLIMIVRFDQKTKEHAKCEMYEFEQEMHWPPTHSRWNTRLVVKARLPWDNVVINECMAYMVKHPELSGCITTLTVRNTAGCKLLCSNGYLDRSRCWWQGSYPKGFGLFPAPHPVCVATKKLNDHRLKCCSPDSYNPCNSCWNSHCYYRAFINSSLS